MRRVLTVTVSPFAIYAKPTTNGVSAPLRWQEASKLRRKREWL